ncbi:hypothetical protein B5P43_15785 [Bacillus sp. SRB_336]|nr:hypothetical protein B5P43_15785 [Bacillus sp. SRB_336]
MLMTVGAAPAVMAGVAVRSMAAIPAVARAFASGGRGLGTGLGLGARVDMGRAAFQKIESDECGGS